MTKEDYLQWLFDQWYYLKIEMECEIISCKEYGSKKRRILIEILKLL